MGVFCCVGRYGGICQNPDGDDIRKFKFFSRLLGDAGPRFTRPPEADKPMAAPEATRVYLPLAWIQGVKGSCVYFRPLHDHRLPCML
ncbi:hypothetical protein D3OALGA1CA_4708 [Olavius algarvensis associated proteobacterium Delta 3]|nr:hypothetical protein D3OALGA1CA_4708 [Olavius algarvensis associated proteobacterium Delta 3]